MANDRATSLHADHALLAGGWTRDVRFDLSGSRIAAITAGVPTSPADQKVTILLPGMPNLHSHAFQRGMAGLAERRGPNDDGFWTWRETMYRFVDRIGPDDLKAIAVLAYVEMLECGFTRVGEFHYLHHDPDGRPFADPAQMADAIAQAAARSGIALTLLPVFYAHSGFGGMAPGAGQRRFVHAIDGFARLVAASRAATAELADAVVGLAPHSLRATTPEELAVILPLAENGPIHIHIAEQVREVEDCLAWSGARPVEWLLDHAPVDERWCLVHATHMTDAETRQMAASGAIAGLCPITEANLGDGLFPIEAYRNANGRWGIGSDSNVLIDMTEELRLLEYGQRLTRRQRNVVSAGACSSTGGTLFREALLGGGHALGAKCGLEVGASADCVSLTGDHPGLIGRCGDDWLDGLVFAGRSMVDGVWRGGVQRVANGRHIDRDAVVADYRARVTRLLAG